MALIFWEGFDSYSTLADLYTAERLNYNLSYLSSFSYGNYTFSATGGRFGGRAVQDCAVSFAGIGTADLSRVVFINPVNEVWTGRAIKRNISGGYLVLQCINMTGSDPMPCDGMIRAEADGSIVVSRSATYGWWSDGTWGTTIGNTAPGVFTNGVWNFIETRWKQSTTTTSSDGIVEVWLNNNLVLSIPNANTRVSAANISTVSIISRDKSTNVFTDDVYALDTSGPAPWNTRLGDCRIVSVAVNADANPNDGVVSTGNVNHWTVVDEIPYSAADWLTLGSAGVGTGEMFKHAALPSTNVFSVLATSVVAVAGKSDAGNATFKLSIQSGSTRANSNTQYLSTSNSYYRQDFTTNPDTSAQWTNSQWEASNVGVFIV